jgi:hypothetical protein
LIVQMELATLSRRGGRNYNEDACGHWHSDSHLCCVVADGAGGHGGGDKASKLAVQFILGAFAGTPEGTPEAIERMILATNRSIIQHRADDRALQNMHSTVVALFIDFEAKARTWGHCSDSRLYVFRAGKDVARTARGVGQEVLVLDDGAGRVPGVGPDVEQPGGGLVAVRLHRHVPGPAAATAPDPLLPQLVPAAGERLLVLGQLLPPAALNPPRHVGAGLRRGQRPPASILPRSPEAAGRFQPRFPADWNTAG